MANAIVGQSGGPTSVINASLAGVFQACQMRGAEHVYGMLHGIQGLLEEKVCDLSERLASFMDIELLKRIQYLTRHCGYTLEGAREHLRSRPAEDPRVALTANLTELRRFLMELKERI